MVPDQRTLDQLSLTRDEYERIIDLLDREPTDVELGMFGAMWSEHCGYKNSRPLLRLFPTDGPYVLTKAGQENAGVIDIGDGLCVAFKIESHNHPSAIEPYEGAATGVGGIVRDIFAMGARPIAILDSLRFGPLRASPGGDAEPGIPAAGRLPATSEEQASRNRRLFTGVVAGIGGYGNCLGIPTVGGEVSFAPSYSGNPLVNAMCVGLARTDRLVRARADGPGNLLILVGADTGRDGIHGATFASVELDETSEERRPAVQVGNPFLEKLLMEACLELTERHHEWVVGLQDLGAAGLTSSTVECAAKAGTGVIIDVAKVPRREAGMTPYEVMLSESQERMLVIVRPQHEASVRGLFERWDLHCATIGVVTDDGVVRVRDGEREVAAIPARLLTDAPTYTRDVIKPAWLDALQRADFTTLSEAAGSTNAQLLDLLRNPELASKRTVWRQYDHQVGTNTVVGPGSDAAVIRIKGTNKAIAVATDGNAAYTYLDPFSGGAIAVAEAARNVACAGARPVAMTNCLNFGNPEKPDVYYQLAEAIRGMAEACRALGVPVVSGNVSLYNETNGEPIWPTPIVGAVGVIDDVSRVVPSAFQRAGDAVLVLGPRLDDQRSNGASGDPGGRAAALAGAELLRMRGVVAGKPAIDLALERALQAFLVEAAERRLVVSAHDVAAGGVAVALAECCLGGGVGADVRADGLTPFEERQSTVIVACPRERQDDALALARTHGLAVLGTGATGGDRMRYGTDIDVAITDLRDAFESGLPAALTAAPVV